MHSLQQHNTIHTGSTAAVIAHSTVSADDAAPDTDTQHSEQLALGGAHPLCGIYNNLVINPEQVERSKATRLIPPLAHVRYLPQGRHVNCNLQDAAWQPGGWS